MSSIRGQLYFVAMIPPEPVLTEVKAFKEIAEVRFDSRRALRSPAHITLVPPFTVGEDRYAECVTLLSGMARTQELFQVRLSGFDVFRPRVIFVNVVMSEPLAAFQAKVSIAMAGLPGLKPLERPFHPHVTIAFKDLRRSRFDEAWDYFSSIEYERTFTARELALLRYENSGWSVVDRMEFQGDPLTPEKHHQ